MTDKKFDFIGACVNEQVSYNFQSIFVLPAVIYMAKKLQSLQNSW